MKNLTTTSFAILGLLSVRSWTTYELTKQAQRSLRWFWPRAERKLYDEPKRLAADGLAKAVEERTGRRRGTRYTITAKGRRELARWLGEVPAPPSIEFEGMVKVFFADAGTLDQMRATLASVAAEAEQRLEQLETMATESLEGRSQFPERVHLAALTLPFQHRQEQATVEWARWALAQIDGWTDTHDPGSWDSAHALRVLLRRL